MPYFLSEAFLLFKTSFVCGTTQFAGRSPKKSNHILGCRVLRTPASGFHKSDAKRSALRWQKAVSVAVVTNQTTSELIARCIVCRKHWQLHVRMLWAREARRCLAKQKCLCFECLRRSRSLGSPSVCMFVNHLKHSQYRHQGSELGNLPLFPSKATATSRITFWNGENSPSTTTSCELV